MNVPPKPVPDADTQPFWDAVAERRLVVQRCAVCGRWIWQPRPMCPSCHTPEPVWTDISGDARVVSWTVLHPPVLPVWNGAVPFAVLLVEPDDAPGVRMLGQLVDDDGVLLRTTGEHLSMGAPVRLRWRIDEGGTLLPAWTISRRTRR